MRVSEKEIEKIQLYLNMSEPDMTPLFDDDHIKQFISLAFRDKRKIIISNNKLIKKLAGFCRIISFDYEYVYKEALRILAFRDALYILAKKNIPVFFYDRVGQMDGYEYSDSAYDRMKDNKSFPCMYRDIKRNETDFKELFGEKYNPDYVSELGNIPQVVKKGNKYCHEDIFGKYINVFNGNRVTAFQPANATKTIHVYGRCGAFGYAVEDSETIPSFLQKTLTDMGYEDYKVVNHGLWGGEDYMLDHNFIYQAQDFEPGDIVLFYRNNFNENILKMYEQYGLWHKDITYEWHDYPEAKWCFYDKPGHMNGNGYKNAAEIIAKDLISKKFCAKEVNFDLLPSSGTLEFHDYIDKTDDVDFEKNINDYLEVIKKSAGKSSGKNNGAIVMNCNPFTYGHRHLIEFAAKKVDYLYIFVVEENKSFFEFEDRYKMVLEGTKDIPNIIVVNSGKFIISSYTFPEYFMKDYVKEKDFDVSNDIIIFCKYIAPRLSITKRFVGEEPLDPVTNTYNEAMKRIMPQYGIELIEIKRKMISDTKVINASETRRLLADNDLEGLLSYVPDTTYQIIIDKYVDKISKDKRCIKI